MNNCVPRLGVGKPNAAVEQTQATAKKTKIRARLFII